jgi:hypothetical protein
MLVQSEIVAKYPPNAKPGFNSPEEVTAFLEKRWPLADIRRYAIPERRHNDEYQNLVTTGTPEIWAGRLYCDKSTGFDSVEWYATIETFIERIFLGGHPRKRFLAVGNRKSNFGPVTPNF